MATNTPTPKKKDPDTGKVTFIESGNPKLGAKRLSDGRNSLFLEYYKGYSMVYSDSQDKMTPKKDRTRETLNLYYLANPRTPIDRQHKKDMLELAHKIRYEREQEFTANREGYKMKKDRQINFLDYFQTYIDNYTKKDVRVLIMALKRFERFLSETPEYEKFAKNIKPEQINKEMVTAFVEFLQNGSVGEGANSIYRRFKKVIKAAKEQGYINSSPCEGVTILFDKSTIKKEVLSNDEIMQLMATHTEKQNDDVRRAFLLCLFCGVRFCDVKKLTFANVDYSNQLLRFEQSKTKGHSTSSIVSIPLNDVILNLIGEPADDNRNALIFKLPSYTMCIKSLQRWVERAGIKKHITWHCARHSFGTNLVNNGNNIKVVSELLGHSGLKETVKYTRAVDKLKKDAINSLTK